MEFGKVERALSKKLNSTVVVYKSKSKPGYVYRFNYKKGDEYVCCRCRELGKYRGITIRNDVVVGRKDPEVDHHEECQEDVSAQEIERHAARREIQRKTSERGVQRHAVRSSEAIQSYSRAGMIFSLLYKTCAP